MGQAMEAVMGSMWRRTLPYIVSQPLPGPWPISPMLLQQPHHVPRVQVPL